MHWILAVAVLLAPLSAGYAHGTAAPATLRVTERLPPLSTMLQATDFYGRIDHLGIDYAVLRDVFTVRREFDPDTQQPRYVLLKRKDDVDGADHMIFPATSIAFVEPVQPDSTIGKLIAQLSSQK